MNDQDRRGPATTGMTWLDFMNVVVPPTVLRESAPIFLHTCCETGRLGRVDFSYDEQGHVTSIALVSEEGC